MPPYGGDIILAVIEMLAKRLYSASEVEHSNSGKEV